MTKLDIEDLCIEFDEYGFEPTILCDVDAAVEHFRNCLHQILKDYDKFKENNKMYNQVIDINELKVGSYISFSNSVLVLYKVLSINYNNNTIKYYDTLYGYTKYEKIGYIKKIFNFNIDK